MSRSHSESEEKKVEKRFARDLIDKLKQFKYKADEIGLCNGLTYAWNLAVLAKDENTFFYRLRIIYESDDLVKKVNEARKKVIEHKPLTPDDQTYLSIPAFMETVSVYQSPKEYEKVFNKKLEQKQIEEISQFTASKAVEEKQGVKEVFNLELRNRTPKEWTTYFDNLREVLKTQPDTSVVISTYNHKMGIKYDSKTDSWNLFDQQLVDFSKGIITKNISHDKIGQEIKDIFARNATQNRLMTRVYSTAETLKKNPGIKEAFKKLHPDKVTVKNLFEVKKEDAAEIKSEFKLPKSGPTFFQPQANSDTALENENIARLKEYKMLPEKFNELKSILPKFLQSVAFGNEAEAKVMLDKNPELLLMKGAVTDYSGRQFEPLSGYQLATWSLDWRMRDLFKKYLDQFNKDEADKQFNEVKTQGVVYKILASSALSTLMSKQFDNQGNEIKVESKANRVMPRPPTEIDKNIAKQINKLFHKLTSYYYEATEEEILKDIDNLKSFVYKHSKKLLILVIEIIENTLHYFRQNY